MFVMKMKSLFLRNKSVSVKCAVFFIPFFFLVYVLVGFGMQNTLEAATDIVTNDQRADDEFYNNFEYVGQVGDFLHYTGFVYMEDNIGLKTDVYIPFTSQGPWPVVLKRTPYPRKFFYPYETEYVFVVQSVRGINGSEGENILFLNDAWGKLEGTARDGLSTYRWIRECSWCNGIVGTDGSSAPGMLSILLNGTLPEGLHAQFISLFAESIYDQAVYPGGAFRKQDVETWLEMHDIDPINLTLIQQNPLYNEFWKAIDASRRRPMAHSPALYICGWFDVFSQGPLDAFRGRQYAGNDGARGKQFLIVGPWTHKGLKTVQQGELTFPDNSYLPQEKLKFQFFERYLRNIHNDVDNWPLVRYYVMGDVDDSYAPGNEWRIADHWPIPAKETPFYLLPDNTLSSVPPDDYAGDFSYKYNPDDPTPSKGGRNLMAPSGPYDQSEIEARDDVITFTTPVLEEPLEITGRIRMHLYAASDCVDTDFIIKLCDVYPDGRSILIAEGFKRARYRGTHKHEKTRLLKPDKIYRFTIDLGSTSIILNEGHQIRVAVQSAHYPVIDANPNTGGNSWEGSPCRMATNTIYCAKKGEPSCIILPVVE